MVLLDVLPRNRAAGVFGVSPVASPRQGFSDRYCCYTGRAIFLHQIIARHSDLKDPVVVVASFCTLKSVWVGQFIQIGSKRCQ